MPDKTQNSYVERLNRTYRDEVLNMYVFRTLTEVREITENWIYEDSQGQVLGTVARRPYPKTALSRGVKKMSENFGRIWFKGNPWPGGHAIEATRLAVHIVENVDDVPNAIGAQFHLSIESMKYADEPTEDVGTIDEDEEEVSWSSRGHWEAHTRCRINGTEVVIGSEKEPFALSRFENWDVKFDEGMSELPEDMDIEDLTFICYVLGHDAVADHALQFRATPGRTNHFDIDWTGAVALAYSGEYEFEYRFRAELKGVPFERIQGADPEVIRYQKDYPEMEKHSEWYDRRQDMTLEERERTLWEQARSCLDFDPESFEFHAGEYRDWLAPKA